jgi:DNA polymerase III subunit delta
VPGLYVFTLFIALTLMPTYAYKDISMILTQAEKGRPAPVYLISGDSYLAREVHQQLINRLLPEEMRSFNLEMVDGEKEDFHSILERLQTFPFFPGRKVVSVKNPIQIFSAGNEDRLWKKVQEAWEKGQPERCARLLRTFLQDRGVSLKLIEGGLKGNEETLREKLFPDEVTPLPEWFKEALAFLQNHFPDESVTLNADQVLDSAIRQGFPQGHILILLLEGHVRSSKIIKSIAEVGVVLNLALKQGKKGDQTNALKGYLKSRLSQMGKTIHPQAEALLLQRIDPEVFQMEMEIQKLVSYLGERKQVLPKDIDDLVGANREEPLYELTTVLGEKNSGEALRKLKQLWEQGFNPLQIISGITNSLRRLLVAKELLKTVSKIPSRSFKDYGTFSATVLPQLKQSPLPDLLSKVHPFVLYNTMKTAVNFSFPHLLSALETLHEADRRLKTSGATPAFLLEDFILSFCQKENSTKPAKNQSR